MGKETSPNKDSLHLLSPSQPPSSSNNTVKEIIDDEDDKTSTDMNMTTTSIATTTQTFSSIMEPVLESQSPDNNHVPVLTAELAPNQQAVTERVTRQLQEQIASQWQQRIHQVVQDRLLNVAQSHINEIVDDQDVGNVGGLDGVGKKERMVPVVAVPLGEEECKGAAASADVAAFDGRLIFCAVLVLAAILVAVGVAIVIRKDGDNNNHGISLPTQSPTALDTNTSPATFTPTVAPTEPNPRWIYLVETLEPFLSLENSTTNDGEWLDLVQTNPLSPQAQALRWMATEDDYSNPPERLETNILLERYVAAILYFSGHKENNIEDEWSFPYLDPSLSVCQWNLGTNILQDSARGLFCTDFEHHGSITYILLQELGLTGTIPSELGLLEQMYGLNLYTNALTGMLPTTQLPGSLVDLQLANNRLSGTLPSIWAATLPRLDTIWAENNRLTGTIPSEWQTLVEMEWLDLGSNQLSGTIPSFMGSSMKHLEFLYLEYNDLSGTLPSEIGSLSSLQHLLVQGNVRLEGTVPAEYANLRGSLDAFWLEDTSLTGSLNEIFCNVSSTRMDRPTLKADCLGDDPEMECSCCDYCCTSDGVDCEAM